MMAFGSRVSRSNEVTDEFEKLVIRMNPPRVSVDNDSDITATLVKVDSANKYGTLLEVVQVLTDLKLTIKRAYITSDGEWFMDVFHVVDQDGNKLYDGQVIDRIEQSLGAGSLSFRAAPERSVGVEAEESQTTIELIGRDRPGLLSEVFAVLTDLRCNIVASEVWTHDARVAALVRVTDADAGGAVEDPTRLDTVKRLLRHVLRGSSRDKKAARAAVSGAGAAEHAQRRLHQMMHVDRARARRGGGERDDGEGGGEASDDDGEGGAASSRGGGGSGRRPVVEVVDCAERGYTLVNVRCRDRTKLLFDTVCTLTDMQYVVFHGTVIAEGSEAYQEYYIRHLSHSAGSSGEDRDRLRRALEDAIERRYTEGLRLELCCEDRVGLLSDVTRIFREHGLSVTHAEVDTRGARAANVFYVVDASSGQPVQAGQAVEAVRAEIGEHVLSVREQQPGDGGDPRSPTGAGGGGGGRRSLGNMIRSRSEKFLYNLGLIRSCS